MTRDGSRQSRDVREVMRDEMVMRDKIADLLRGETKTIPQIAQSLGCPNDEVVMWVMAMRRYGMLSEKGRPDEDGYFVYELTEEQAS